MVFLPYSITIDTPVTMTVLLVGTIGVRRKGRGNGKPKGREKKDSYQHYGNTLMAIFWKQLDAADSEGLVYGAWKMLLATGLYVRMFFIVADDV
jgi:hypothetical protein